MQPTPELASGPGDAIKIGERCRDQRISRPGHAGTNCRSQGQCCLDPLTSCKAIGQTLADNAPTDVDGSVANLGRAIGAAIDIGAAWFDPAHIQRAR